MRTHLRATGRALAVIVTGVVLLLVPVTDRVDLVSDPAGGSTTLDRLLALLPALVAGWTSGDWVIAYTHRYALVAALLVLGMAAWTYRRTTRPSTRDPAERLWP